MDTRTLQTFLRVHDLGSFTKAASELGYAQSTVTVQIRQLEQELGYPLFDRLGKRVYLTDLGRQFLPCAMEIVDLAQQAGALGKDPQQIRGTLRLGVLESLLFTTLTEILPQYQERFPLVELEVKMGRTKDLMAWLRENKLDLVYYSGEKNADRELDCSYCRKERMAFVAPPDSPLAGRKTSLETFLAQPLIVTERSGVCYRRLKALAEERGIPVRHAMELDNTKTILELVAKGSGYAFLPGYSVVRDVKNGLLTELDVDVPEQTYYSQIVSHSGKWAPPYQTGLVELIRQAKPENV